MQQNKSSGSSFFFIANLLNFVLATAVFTLPYPMYKTGYILGLIVLAVSGFLSVTACTFIVEALGRKNSIVKNEKKILRESLGINDSIEISTESKAPLMDSEKNEGISKELSEEILQKDDEEYDEFHIAKRYEISKLSKILPKPLYFFVTIVIIMYLYVGITSNSIIAGNNLKDIIGKTIGKTLGDYWYKIIVSIFFLITICLALNNIKHLKKFSMFIMIMRFVVIALIFGGSIYAMAKHGVTKISTVKPLDFSNITVMIGNSLFVFMSHHSIPGMVENFYPQKNLIRLLIIGYACSFVFLVFYGYIAILAFGNKNYSCDYENQFPAAIQSTFSSNFIKIKVIGYIINYYPVLNVITSGMQLITLRNNILDALGGCKAEWHYKFNFAEKEGVKNIMYNFVFNLVIAIPPIVIGLLLENVQDLMKYFSSILGFMLMVPVPIIVVSGYRFLFQRRNFQNGLLNMSFLKGTMSSIIIISVTGVIVFGLIIYGLILNKKNSKCIFDKVNFGDL